MVFIPTEQKFFASEYYKAAKKANANIQPMEAAEGTHHVRSNADLAGLNAEFDASQDPLLAVQARKDQRRKKDAATLTQAEKKDIVAARLRGGLVQYMLKMGYSMELAMREATRAVAQMINNDKQIDDAASRQVFLSRAGLTPFIANTNENVWAEAVKIATTPRAYVDFKV